MESYALDMAISLQENQTVEVKKKELSKFNLQKSWNDIVVPFNYFCIKVILYLDLPQFGSFGLVIDNLAVSLGLKPARHILKTCNLVRI